MPCLSRYFHKFFICSTSTVASLHRVDLKPLLTLFYRLQPLAEFAFTNYLLRDPASSDTIGRKNPNMKRKNVKHSV